VHPNDLARLDAAEQGYDRVSVHLSDGEADHAVFTYRARADRIVPGLRPYRWYRDLVALGARQQGFPAGYVAAIEAVAAGDDPDPVRRAAMDALLAQLRGAAP
jgi:hypothetical protein